MGIEYEKPMYVTENPAVTSPFINIFTKRITISASWLRKYHRSEILAAIAHELGHLKGQGKFSSEILLAYITPIIFVLGFELLTIAFGLPMIPIFCQIAAFSMMMFVLSYVMWRNEYRADIESGKALGPEPLIAVFESIKEEVKNDDGTDTHPPIHERIKRLKSLFVDDE